MHPHIPRPRRKATRTCTDTASVVRTVHGEFMWPFTARVSKNRTDRTDRCRCNLPPPKGRPQADLCSTVKRPTPGLRALPPMTAQIATVLGPAPDEPGALQQPSTVHVSEGSAYEKGARGQSDASYQEADTRSSLVERRQWGMGWHCNRWKRVAA